MFAKLVDRLRAKGAATVPSAERGAPADPRAQARLHLERGNALKESKRHEEAIESYKRAVELAPDFAEAFENMGFCLVSIGLIETAIRVYNHALTLDPQRKYLLGMRRHAQMHICDWESLAPDLQLLAVGIDAGRPVAMPFVLAALIDSPRLQRQAAEIWVREECPGDATLGPIPARAPGAKLRVGYFSADFTHHAVSILSAELFELHDRSRFEITAFAFGAPADDAMRARLTRSFDRFIDVREQSDAEVAALARELGIDIAVDLGGFTVLARTGIFARRAAPIQLGYLGYLGTMGAPYMDYLVADATLIPPQERAHYAERILYLPSYQVNDSRRRIAEHRFTREELGLPPQGFVFACFNANYKILPATFESWMRILKRVPGSSLFLYVDNPVSQRNLLAWAQRSGVEAPRIVFGERIAADLYLARLRAMDLFLDTLPYNAGATASDALWAGLPVLTCAGRAFPARMAASLLQAVGLPELITTTLPEYEDRAVQLAMESGEMARIRGVLAQNRGTARLFDTARFARTLEAAFTRIHERRGAGLPPEDIDLGAPPAPATNPAPTNPTPTIADPTNAATTNADPTIAMYDEMIRQHPEGALAHYKRANALNGLGRREEALAGYDRAVALDPSLANAFCNRGTVLQSLHRWEEALASYDRAVDLDPGDALAHYNRGAALMEVQRMDDALASYDRAIALNPDYFAAHVNRGNVLQALRRHELAIASYDKSIELNPTYPEAFMGRGISLAALRRFQEALVSYERALVLRPHLVAAHINRGNALSQSGRHEEAVASYDTAIGIEPAHAEAHSGRGYSLFCLRRHPAALASYGQALALKPDQRHVPGFRRHIQMLNCQWDGFEADIARLSAGLKALEPVSPPLPVLAMVESAQLHRLAAEIWVRDQCPPDESLGPIPVRPRGEKIRVGYFSADFREHPVSVLLAGVFEAHDRSRFEIIAFAFGPAAVDPMRARLEKAFDRFLDVRDLSDIEVAALARRLQIDIAVDLGGHTEHSRTGIFALRAAPVQVSYLGYPGTMGAPYMDYLIADGAVVPESHAHFYSEQIVRLPACYLPAGAPPIIADRAPSRAELGLPAGFVFCCFNNNYKITPATFERWMRILIRAEGSVLWLARNHQSVARNLQQEAARRGVDPRRLVFADRVASTPEHLARLRAADLFLDTLPYNAHATALDALWVDLPVLTLRGEGFVSRAAASLLSALALPDLITDTPAEYEERAAQLAENPAELCEIRRRLARNRAAARCFDIPAFTRDLESVYVQILAEPPRTGATSTQDVPAGGGR